MPSYSGISPQLTANVQQARTNLELGKRLASLGLRVGLSPRVRLAGAQASGTAVSARRRLVDLDADLAAARGVREGCTTASEVLMASTASLSDSVASGAMTVDDATNHAVALLSGLGVSLSIKDRRGNELLSGAYAATKFGGAAGALIPKLTLSSLGTNLVGVGLAIFGRALAKTAGCYDPAVSLSSVLYAGYAQASLGGHPIPAILDGACVFGAGGLGQVPPAGAGAGAPADLRAHGFLATEGGPAAVADAQRTQRAMAAAGMNAAWFGALGFLPNDMDNAGRGAALPAGGILTDGFVLNVQTLSGLFAAAGNSVVGVHFAMNIMREIAEYWITPAAMACASAAEGVSTEADCVQKTETLNQSFYDDSVAASPEVIATSLQTAKNTSDEALRLLTIILQQLREQSHAVDKMM